MQYGRWSDWQLQQWLDSIVQGDTWLAIFSDDPFAAINPLTVEHFGTTYSRPKADFSRTGPKLISQGLRAIWHGLPVDAPVVAIGGFDAPTNGNLRFAVPEPEDAKVPQGGSYQLPANALYLGLDT